LLFNEQQRHIACQTTAVKVKSSPELFAQFQEVTTDPHFKEKLQVAIQDPSSLEGKEILRRVSPLIGLTAPKIPFGPMERKKSVAELYAYWTFFNSPTWFFTLAPSDIDSRFIFRLASSPKSDDVSVEISFAPFF
jgi:hypothetical protein